MAAIAHEQEERVSQLDREFEEKPEVSGYEEASEKTSARSTPEDVEGHQRASSKRLLTATNLPLSELGDQFILSEEEEEDEEGFEGFEVWSCRSYQRPEEMLQFFEAGEPIDDAPADAA